MSKEDEAFNLLVSKIEKMIQQEREKIFQQHFKQLLSKIDALNTSFTTLYNRLLTIIEDKESLKPVFVESSYEKKDFQKRINKILHTLLHDTPSKTPSQVLIMGYFDQAVLKELMEIVRNKKRQVKLISPELSGSRHDQVNREALMKLQEVGGEIKKNKMLHSRIFLVEKPPQVMIGSCDLKSDCLGGRRYDATVWSDHPELVKCTKEFFQRIWDRSNPFA